MSVNPECHEGASSQWHSSLSVISRGTAVETAALLRWVPYPVGRAGCGPGTLVRAASRPGGQPVCSNHVHVSVAPMELCCELGVNLVYQHGARIEQFADFAKTKLGTH